ncbi:MAG: glycosyltransferase [Candidatus Moranbacteria bacterium]|nr:glycosyltransferase [Candidatus Moranbacteria bacterium]
MSILNKPKKVALVHDFLVSYGGAERVFEALAQMYPEAPIYTLLYDAERMGEHFQGRDIRVSWLGKLPRFIQKRYRLFLPFFPSAIESLDLREFDLVISSSGAWSKGIITRLHTTHIAYLHSPMRYAWDYHESYLRELGVRGRRSIITRMLMSYLRIWDAQAAERPDVLLANSQFTQARIQKYYRREAQVIYPGALTLFEKSGASLETAEVEKESDRYFLVVSRLTRSKKIDMVIEAFNKLSLPLLVVGTGPEEKRLQKMARGKTRFIGFATEGELAKLYQGARAVIFPSEEDFGMVAVEALSFGTPVIGLEYGGLREIITPGVTGEFFHSFSPEIIAEGVHRFLEKEGTYDKTVLQASVQKFSTENFQRQISEEISKSK